MNHQRPALIANILGFCSAVLAFLDIVASYSTIQILVRLSVSYNPEQTVTSAYQVLLGERIGIICAGLLLLIAAILIFQFYGRAETRRALLKRAAIVISVQLFLIAISYLLPIYFLL